MSDHQDYELDPRIQQQRKARREELRKKRQQRKIIIYAALAVILVLVIVLSIHGCTNKDANTNDDPADSQTNTPPEDQLEPVQPPEDPEPVAQDASATLAAVGDIMCYDEQIADALTPENTYDFTHCLAEVADLLSGADVTIGNLETTFSGSPYLGYPTWSAPPELASALAGAGFDILQTANTYSLENGMTGLQKTISTIEEYGMSAAGTYGNAASAQENGGVLVRDVNGIKFAFIAYTKGINGRPRPADNSYCVNLLYTDYTSNYSIVDETTLLRSVQSAKATEADVIVALLHWGGEYDVAPNESQSAIADLLFKNGVDVILGSHAHVVGPMEERTVTTLDGETKNVFIAYSLGNFLSSMDKPNVQPTVVLNLSFFKSGETGETTITKAEYVPLYMADMGEDAEDRYQVLDIAAEVDRYIGGADDKVSTEIYGELKDALNTLQTNAGTTYAAN